MLLREFTPHPALREFIQCYRICHFDFGANSPVPIKLYAPKPESVLHFFIHDYWAILKPGSKRQTYSSMVFFGQRTTIMHQFTGPNFLNAHIVFQPSAVFRLTGISASEFTNQHLDPELIFASGVKQVLARLQDASEYQEMVTVLEQFCFRLVKRSRHAQMPFDVVSRHMIPQGGLLSLQQLANSACYSTKQFTRKFLQRVGVNPKLYARIIRFNRAYNLKNAFPDRDWLSIVVECGYHDYQHMSKDYVEFTGLSPEAFDIAEALSPERKLGLTSNLYQQRIACYGPS